MKKNIIYLILLQIISIGLFGLFSQTSTSQSSVPKKGTIQYLDYKRGFGNVKIGSEYKSTMVDTTEIVGFKYDIQYLLDVNKINSISLTNKFWKDCYNNDSKATGFKLVDDLREESILIQKEGIKAHILPTLIKSYGNPTTQIGDDIQWIGQKVSLDFWITDGTIIIQKNEISKFCKKKKKPEKF